MAKINLNLNSFMTSFLLFFLHLTANIWEQTSEKSKQTQVLCTHYITLDHYPTVIPLIQWLHNTSKQRLRLSISLFTVSSTTIYDHEHRTAVFLEQMTHSNSQSAGSPIVIAQMLKGSIKRSCCVWRAGGHVGMLTVRNVMDGWERLGWMLSVHILDWVVNDHMIIMITCCVILTI